MFFWRGMKARNTTKTICLFSAVHFQMALYVFQKEKAHHFFSCVYLHLIDSHTHSVWVQMAPHSRPYLSAWHNHSLWQIFMVIIFEVVLMSFKILRTGLSIHCPAQMASILPKHTPIYLANHHWKIVCLNVQYLLNVLSVIIPKTKG